MRGTPARRPPAGHRACHPCPPPCAACCADQFRAYFSQYGEVVEAQIMQDHMSGRSRGFG